MDGLELELDGWPVEYLPLGVLVTDRQEVANFDVFEDKDLAIHQRMRRIIVRYQPKLPRQYYLLHWSSGLDLVTIDRLVAARTATAEDFTDALVGELNWMTCSECNSSFRAVVETPSPIFSKDSIRRSREHQYVTHCPYCSARLRTRVLEVLDHAGPM